MNKAAHRAAESFIAAGDKTFCLLEKSLQTFFKKNYNDLQVEQEKNVKKKEQFPGISKYHLSRAPLYSSDNRTSKTTCTCGVPLRPGLINSVRFNKISNSQ
ncbi:MAG: hypothetical protein ACRC3B_20205 [Bacteroidia bacterium]